MRLVARAQRWLAPRALPRCRPSQAVQVQPPSELGGPFVACGRWRGLAGASAPSMTNMPTTDATFRYRTFDWESSCGEKHDYEYIVAQQPAGGSTARNALLAVEEGLPRPPSGWSVVLIPSVSLFCSGKEEMRPLATVLSQRGHRCYILEWPGWTSDIQTNFSLARCKMEELSREYEDFWCQLLEHVAQVEMAEEAPSPPRLCLVGAGHSAVYALRALRALQDWRPPDLADSANVSQAFSSLVMIAPTWQTVRHGLSAYMSAPRASRWIGSWLNSGTRFGRWYRGWHASRSRLRRHFAHRGAPASEADRLMSAATWLFQRPRPYLQTDAAVLSGLLDPPGVACASELACELQETGAGLGHGLLLLLPDVESSAAGKLSGHLAGTLAEPDSEQKDRAVVECSRLSAKSLLPHEVAPSQVIFALDRWLSQHPSAGVGST